MASEAAKLETTRKCPVCKHNLRDPRRLHCGHQICTDCLQQLTSASAKTDTFHCPSCNSEWTLPEKGVADLPTVKCASGHRRIRAMRGHNTRPVDKISPEEVSQAQSPSPRTVCTEHDQPLNILCKTCNTLICSTCALFDHKEHWYKELGEVAKGAQKELEYMTVSATEYIVNNDILVTEMGHTDEDICTSVKVAKDKVKKAAKRIRVIIDSHEQDLLRDLDRHETELRNKLGSIVKESENKKNAVLTLKRESESLAKSGRPINQVQRTPAIREKLDVRKKSEQQNMTWRYVLEQNQHSEEALKAMLGSVKMSSPLVIKQGKITLGEYIIQVPLKSKGLGVTGMVVIGDCLCVTRNGDPDLWLYDLVSGRNKACPVTGVRSIRGMALLNSLDRTVVITDESSDGGKLHFVRISTSLDISVIRVKNIPGKYPWRISVSRETGELLIGNRWGPEFAICNEECDVQRQVTVTSPDRTGGWSFCVTRTKDGYAALMRADSGKFIIQYLDEDGNYTHTYGYNDGEQLKHAYHMITDTEGRLIVADNENHRLHLVDTRGHLSQFLLTEDAGIRYPDCVYLDEAVSRLYVSHGLGESREVRVYRWSSKSGDTKTTNFQLELNLGQF